MRHTHADIKDADLRKLFARELVIMRKVAKRTGVTMQGDWMRGVRLGFETALRRVEAMNEQMKTKMNTS